MICCMICCSFLRKWSCAVRCAAFLVQEQITLASPRVHMFRFFPVKSLGVFQPASVSFSLLAEVTDAQLRSAVSHVWRMNDPSANWGETPREPLPGRAAPGDKCQSSSASSHQVSTAPFSPVLLESLQRGERCSGVLITSGVPLEAASASPFSSWSWWSQGRCYEQKHLIPAHTAQEWRWLCFFLMWDGTGQKCHP